MFLYFQPTPSNISPGPAFESCKVLEHVRVFLVPLKVVTGDEILNALLDCFDIRLHNSIAHNHVSRILSQACYTKILRRYTRIAFFFSHSMTVNLDEYLKHPSQLLYALHHQLLMTQDFSTFHDPHNCSINSISPVFVHVFDDLLPFIHRWKRNL